MKSLTAKPTNTRRFDTLPTATCPVCEREIVLEDGRLSQHTDKRYWHEPPPLRACPAVGQRA